MSALLYTLSTTCLSLDFFTHPPARAQNDVSVSSVIHTRLYYQKVLSSAFYLGNTSKHTDRKALLQGYLKLKKLKLGQQPEFRKYQRTI
jgi:hypothetical protein